MNRIALLLALAFQFGTLAWMAGEREWILATGRTVFLRTAPVDPMDPFRGEHVVLRYGMSDLSLRDFSGGAVEKDRKGLPVYALLDQDPQGVAAFHTATTVRPADGLFIRGRTTGDHWRWQGEVPVRYGIEAYFVEQGSGRKLEGNMRRADGIQVPLEMETALSASGTAVLKGHRWCRLGLGLEILAHGGIDGDQTRWRNQRIPLRTDGRKSCRLRFTLMNVSDAPLALVLLPEHGSFVLQPASAGTRGYRQARAADDATAPTDDMVVVLAPGARHAVDLDMADPRWLVRRGDDAQAVEIGTLTGWDSRFRLVYAPPAPGRCAGLRAREQVWHGRLENRAFQGDGGQVD